MSLTRLWTQRQRALLAVAFRRRRRGLRLAPAAGALLIVCAATAAMLYIARQNLNEAPPALRMLDRIESVPVIEPDFMAEPPATNHADASILEPVLAPVEPTQEVEPPVKEVIEPKVVFNGKAVRPVKTIRMRVTGYCSCSRCCGRHADGKTASGYPVWINGGKLAAADTRLLPFGTLISIPGYAADQPVPVLDRGGKITGYRLDLYFHTHREARQWGTRYLDVTIWERIER